jgi:hypothetical protein
MSSPTLSEPHPKLLAKAMTAGLNRWKLETLTGLLGFRALEHHQSETQKNIEAENKRVRQQLWNDEPAASQDMPQQGHTILGDYNPPQVIVTGQPQSSGVGKVLAGAAIAVGLLGIPAAGVIGYGLSKVLDKSPPEASVEDNSLDVGLGRFEDLLRASE